MRILLLAVWLLFVCIAPDLLAQEVAEAAGPTLFERLRELYDTIQGNWDAFLLIAFFLLTGIGGALELITRLKKTETPDGFLTRAGLFVDKLLAKVPNRIKEKAKAEADKQNGPK